MKIKISDKIISYPPYVSTTWENIKSLRTEPSSTGQEFLVITLSDGYRVKIPDVEPKLKDLIFNTHLNFIEQKNEPASPLPSFDLKTMPLKFGVGAFDSIGGALQHNPSQSHLPDLPIEVTEKIKNITKLISPEELSFLPKAEPHCNCMHCQLAKAMHNSLENTTNTETFIEEEVSDEDLKFRLWDIQQSADKLYVVKNPSDHLEQYSVFLGDPIGCTCGNKNCEHIKAVLNS
jgi:hypothetical protein